MKTKTFLSTLLICLSMLLSNSQNDIYDVCRNGSLQQIEKIYAQDSTRINKPNPAGYSPLILACYHGNERVAKFLIDKTESINDSSDFGTALMAATVKENINIVKLLLANGADPNIADGNGRTALHYSCMRQNLEITELLINAKANYNAKNNVGKSPMDFAKTHKDKELISILKD